MIQVGWLIATIIFSVAFGFVIGRITYPKKKREVIVEKVIELTAEQIAEREENKLLKEQAEFLEKGLK